MNVLMTKRKVGLLLLGIVQLIVLSMIAAMQLNLSYYTISVLAIVQCVVNIILLKIVCNLPVLCIPNMFSVFSLFFHCGQIIKEGFNVQGTVPLPFQYFADEGVIQKACLFYLMSQATYFIGLASTPDANTSFISDKWNQKNEVDTKVYGKALMIVGVIPRLYIDISSLLGALSQGYRGVYSLYFPQMIQSIAFFFDAGIILYLFGLKEKKKMRATLFVVLLYKCLMMTTGARQEKVAYLIVLLYLYFFVCNTVTVGKIAMVVAGCVAGFIFISAIGTVRTGSSSGIKDVLELMQSGQMSNIFGSALGEFGSAFDTLEVAVKYTPAYITYGYGTSYLAGLISIIPLVVKQIPFLDKATIFVHQLPGGVYFALGGSYLGELYYNFSWLGLIGSAIIGKFMGKLNLGIVLSKQHNALYGAWCAIISTAMIMFVRGYFTDMMQKLVWTYFIISLIYAYLKRRST